MNIVYTGRFKKDYKRMVSRDKDASKLWEIIEKLLEGKPLPERCQDHPLSGNWAKRRDCRIEPDWILIYKVEGDDLILERTGTHSDLFR